MDYKKRVNSHRPHRLFAQRANRLFLATENNYVMFGVDCNSRNEEGETVLQRLLDTLAHSDVVLYQDTKDVEQLSPASRLASIQNVYTTCEEYLQKPTWVLDIGSGFGYGVAFFATMGVPVIGVEKIAHKAIQGIKLFETLGLKMKIASSLEFSLIPSILLEDCKKLEEERVADLITMFYLSGELVRDPDTFIICKRLLKEGGAMLLSTEASITEVRHVITQIPVPFDTVELFEIEGSFEKTAILLS